MTNGDEYAGSTTSVPVTPEEQKKSDQQFLADQPATPAAPTPTPESALPSVTDMYRFGLKTYMDAEAQIEKNNARLAPLYDKLNQSLSQPLPQMPQFAQVPPPPSQQQIDQRLNQGRFSYLAIGLPLAFLLGARGKNAAWYAMGAFGQGLNQLQQGNMQGAHEMFETWQQAAKYAQEENSQRLEIYKTVLENRNLTLNQQTTLLESLSRQLNDPYINRAAMGKDMIAIAGEMAKGEAAGKQWETETNKLTIQNLDAMGKTPEGQAYATDTEKKYGVNPYDWRDSLKKHGTYDGNFKEAQHLNPYDDFNKKYWADIAGAKSKDTGVGGMLDTRPGGQQPETPQTAQQKQDQEFKAKNKALGIAEEPLITSQEEADALPPGSHYKVPGDTHWYEK